MARAKPTVQPTLLMLVMLPFWTSFLLRVYAWKGPAQSEGGWVADLLIGLGLDQVLAGHRLHPGSPGKLMNTPFSLVLGMTYTYLPFMILPLYSNLAKMDLRLLEAAADLGATPWTGVLEDHRAACPRPASLPGSMLVFIPCVGEFVIPELLGGPETLMIGRVVWDEFFSNNDWPMASSLAVVMILLIIVPLALFNKYQAEAQETALMLRLSPAFNRNFGKGLAGGRLCLPVPAHRGAGDPVVQRFAGAQCMAWLHPEVVCQALANDSEMLGGLWLSLKIAFLHRLRLGGAGHLCRVCAGEVQAFFWPHRFQRHGQRTVGDARGGGGPVVAADDGVHPARHRLS